MCLYVCVGGAGGKLKSVTVYGTPTVSAHAKIRVFHVNPKYLPTDRGVPNFHLIQILKYIAYMPDIVCCQWRAQSIILSSFAVMISIHHCVTVWTSEIQFLHVLITPLANITLIEFSGESYQTTLPRKRNGIAGKPDVGSWCYRRTLHRVDEQRYNKNLW